MPFVTNHVRANHQRLALAVFFLMTVSGCITPSEKKNMQGDIFNVQTRLLTLEQQLTENKSEVKTTGDSASKRIASAKADMDKIQSELQRIHGDIDTLRVGVVTGQLPGTDPEKEGSVAATLNALSARIEAIEAAQEDLLDAIKKSGGSKHTADKKADKHKVGGVDELQQAFDDKHFKQVVDEAPKFVKESKGIEREQARFLLAESYFKLGKMRDAALKFNELVDSKPSGKYLPASKMRIGDCFKSLGDESTARLYYEETIKDYPKSEEAAKAKERLAELGKGGKDKG